MFGWNNSREARGRTREGLEFFGPPHRLTEAATRVSFRGLVVAARVSGWTSREADSPPDGGGNI
jgi:hypothetical protein